MAGDRIGNGSAGHRRTGPSPVGSALHPDARTASISCGATHVRRPRNRGRAVRFALSADPNEVPLTIVGLLAVVALIAANGYFVAGEFAFVASRRSRFVEQAGESGRAGRRARRALGVHRRLSFMLSGAQLGITVTSLVLGFIAEPAIAGVIEPLLVRVGLESASFGISIVIAFVLATMSQMVFGELAPKNLAIAKPERVALWVAPTTALYMRLFGPIIRFFDGSANRLLRLFRIEPVEELRATVSSEELDIIVDSSAESGHLTLSQAALLERAIDFAELEASDAMVPWNRVVTISAEASAADLRDLMASAHSRFPVVDGDGRVQGVVHAKDLLGVPRNAYDTTPVSSLSREILVVPEAAGLTVVLGQLRSHSTEMAIVIDEYGGPAGVVTLEDVVEELVGEIEDEYDPSAPGEHIEVEPGIWSVAASSRPDEIERITGLALPDGEYDTVAGLVLDRLERIPETGDMVVVDGVSIEVLEVDGFAIQQVLLRVVPGEEEDGDERGENGGRDGRDGPGERDDHAEGDRGEPQAGDRDGAGGDGVDGQSGSRGSA